MTPPTEERLASLTAEVTAMQMTVLALIKVHPQKREVLTELDSMIAMVQLTGAQLGGQGLPESFRAAFERFRTQLAK